MSVHGREPSPDEHDFADLLARIVHDNGERHDLDDVIAELGIDLDE